MTRCDLCAAFGHTAARCPLKTLELQRNPYHLDRPRPKPRPVSDPALREANANTVFLIPQKRLV